MRCDRRAARVLACLLTLLGFTGPTLAQETPPPQPAPATAPATQAASAPAAGGAPVAADQPVALSFTNAQMAQIGKFLTDQLGKPVIVSPDLQNTRVTLVNPRKLPPAEALFILRTALHEYGVAIEEHEHTIHLVPLAKIAQRQVELIPSEVDLATIGPDNKIVRKVFDVRHCDPNRLIEVLKPLMPNYGHLTADPSSGKLIAVATVEQLRTIAEIIREWDQPDRSGRELRVFRVEHVDVYEIVPTLQKLIAGYLGVEVEGPRTSGGAPAPTGPPSPQPGGGPPGAAPSGEAAAAGSVGIVSIKAERREVLLIPDPRRASIVVEAPPHLLAQIEVWLRELDYPKPPATQTEIVEVRYGDADDLSTQLNNMLANLPDESLRSAMRIFPFASSRRIMLVGSEQNRQIVKEWLADIDIADAGLRITRTFTLAYADAQQIAENIKEVFQDEEAGRRGYFYYGYSRQTESDRTKVTVTANARNNSITVLASPEKMARIAEQIEEWDRPFEGEEAAPRVFTLQYADPEAAKELLESLYTKKEEAARPWWWDEEESQAPSPVGRLFGQFRFEAYPELGKLIVVAKNEENYGVIERMIAQIDQPQLAGLPRIIELKFADAETLAEQLNALLNAPGTQTSILRRGRIDSFREMVDEGSPYSTRSQPQARQPDQPEAAELSVMQFWWQNPAPEVKAKQPSNLIGKLRIVPNVEQNLLMVAAPEEYVEAIGRFVENLDKPGYQVLIKAVIAEIEHEDATSLGYRFSTDPTVFTSGDPLITDDALRGLLTYTFEDNVGDRSTLTFNMDVNNLLSLLRRVTKLRIRSEPKILTADNVEGEFFDGQDIPFISNTQTTDVGGLTQGFDYFPVGITLRVRPHITKEATIDLMVNLRVSSVIPGRTLFGGAVVDRRETTTRVVLEHARTFMISGILRGEKREITRRIPGLGDIPLLGELFKHRELADVNTELIVFLTPYVIGPEFDYDKIESEPKQRMDMHMLPTPGAGEPRAQATESAETDVPAGAAGEARGG